MEILFFIYISKKLFQTFKLYFPYKVGKYQINACGSGKVVRREYVSHKTFRSLFLGFIHYEAKSRY